MTSKVIIFAVVLCLVHVAFAGVRIPRQAEGDKASGADKGGIGGGGIGGSQNLGSFAGVFEKLPTGFLQTFVGLLEKFNTGNQSGNQ
ncbi:unnamed protein product [Pieris macdunnoughi]|uniref:Secreted protein n=1 Tax=Pieris macdunnoughi TaxID=345717 RepID=A0A821PNZ5_9NEOP|nr:unnamed protein product [Pieris macdunnoughi]